MVRRVTKKVVGRSITRNFPTSDLWILLKWTIAHRLIALAILLLSNKYVQPFDSSGSLLLKLDSTKHTFFGNSVLRWDILHFLGVASPRPLPLSDMVNTHFPLDEQIWSPIQGAGGGLQYEHSLAFQPGIIWLLHLAGYTSRNDLDWSPIQALSIVGSLAILLSISFPLLFYLLTMLKTNNRRLAKLSSFLSIFAFAPATLITPTPEPFFGFFALVGHTILAFHNNENLIQSTILCPLLASISYALACCFRANGIILAGFIIWQLIWNQRNSNWFSFIGRALWALSLTLVIISPFILSQVWAFNRLCTNSAKFEDWCKGRFVLPYNYIQSHYWNVGLFRYWTFSQLPNWILASPVLFLLGRWVISYFKPDPQMALHRTIAPFMMLTGANVRVAVKKQTNNITLDVNTAPDLLPYAYYTFILLFILILSSHVQIALRFATQGALPAVWWSMADLVEGKRFSLQSILAFMLSWQVISIVLYAGFYPPA